MSFVHHALNAWSRATGIGGVAESQARKDEVAADTPPAPPNPNDAANAAQSQADALRQRRGLLANIYAGNNPTQPVAGKTTLG